MTAQETYVPFQTGSAVGTLRLLDRIGPDVTLARDEIVIVGEPPVTLPPVAGLVTTSSPSPLSHLHILARSWSIPDAYVADAATRFAALSGTLVRFEVRGDAYSVAPATDAERAEFEKARGERRKRVTPRADLTAETLTDLAHQRRADAVRFGSKSANLGELVAAHIEDVIVPDGVAIPFAWYQQALKANGIDGEIAAMLAEPRFESDAAYRATRLEALRHRIEGVTFDPDRAGQLLDAVHTRFGTAGVFVRSSTNAEDLPEFSGAGLYTTVPNVKGDDALLAAVKTVWASVWNRDAYEARVAAGIDPSVYPAVLVQLGIDADAAGVAVTTNPFNPVDRHAVYVTAKRGLGIRVVEGKKIPEQILFHAGATPSIRVITSSADDTALGFAPEGGVKEVPVTPGRAVLSDALVKRLTSAATAIEHHFGTKPVDIEWLTRADALYIVQVRPYQE